MSPLPTVPEEVRARLGPRPAVVSGQGPGAVATGNGLVLKSGPTDVMDRERFVLIEMSRRLPLDVPEVIDAGSGWLLLADVADVGTAWDPVQLGGAVRDLAVLHAALEGDEATADARLRDPLGSDLPALLAYSRRLPGLDGILPGAAAVAADPSPLLDPLLVEPPSLLHGDPWPPNVRRPATGRRVWLDWSGASRGPGALDLATWLDQTAWVVDGLNHQTQFDAYVRAREITDVVGFRRAVDAASVLWFLAVDLPRLPVVRHAPAVVDRLLGPRRAALERLGLAT